MLFAEDRDELLDWLRTQKLVHVDRELGWMMVHAGLAPKWTTAAWPRSTRARSRSSCTATSYRKLLKQHVRRQARPGTRKLAGIDRHRAIINVFTRMRYCTPRGRIAFEEKGAPGTQTAGPVPLVRSAGPRRSATCKIVCGHWSTLGLFIGHGVHAIDTGAVWGGKLTALQLDTDELRLVQVPGRDVPANPPRPRAGSRPSGPTAPAATARDTRVVTKGTRPDSAPSAGRAGRHVIDELERDAHGCRIGRRAARALRHPPARRIERAGRTHRRPPPSVSTWVRCMRVASGSASA